MAQAKLETWDAESVFGARNVPLGHGCAMYLRNAPQPSSLSEANSARVDVPGFERGRPMLGL